MAIRRNHLCSIALLCAAGATVLIPRAWAASCTTEAQMTAPQRDALMSAGRALLLQAQSGDVQGLRANAVPAVAANAAGLQGWVQYMQPLLKGATITVDEVYLLDASTDTPGEQATDFFCGSPVVGFNFTGLPPATYALAILHATGVHDPQQVSFLLSKAPPDRWLLANLFNKPMVEAGHDGLWYWSSARKFAQDHQDWAAWFYYRIATDLLDPVSFLSSPNLTTLQSETGKVHPTSFPGTSPLTLNVSGATFSVTSIEPTTTFGPLDLEVHYAPNPTQIADLRSPANARKQVTDLMAALVRLHPELPAAFHGMWIHADEGKASVFALELPMSGNTANGQQSNVNSSPLAH